MTHYNKPTKLEKAVNSDVNQITQGLQFRIWILLLIFIPFLIFFWSFFMIPILFHWFVPGWVDKIMRIVWIGMMGSGVFLVGFILYMSSCFQNIEKMAMRFMRIGTNRNTIDQICDDLWYILSSIKQVYYLRFLIYIVLTRASSNRALRKIQEIVLDRILPILTDFRSDLTLRLAEQQKTLKSAKSDVEKNISWTPELNGVSDLQKARLDRQIEQFEELQKVLMKV